MNTSLKKKAMVVLLMAALLAPVAPVYVPRAQAYGIVNFTVGDLQRLLSELLERAAIMAAKTAIQSVTRSTVNWIRSGFDGSPAFERNLGVNLRRLADGVAAQFVSELATNTTINSPWLSRVAGTIATGYLLYTSRDRLAARIQYTLDRYTDNPQAWFRGDFNRGGLNAWMATTWMCGNDPQCVEFAAQEELINRIDSSLQQRIEELGWGQGFLSWRCNCPGGSNAGSLSDADNTSGCQICTPGTTLAGKIEFLENQPELQLTVADSIDQVLGALASQLISEVMGEGGLFGGGDTGNDASRGQLGGFATGDATLLATLSAGFVQTVQSDRTNVIAYRDSWIKVRDAATEAAAACTVVGNARASEANLALAQASAAIAKAGRAITALDSIITRAQAVQGGTNAASATITSDYNCLTSGGTPENGSCTRPTTTPVGATCPVSALTLPGGSEIACIARETAESAEDGTVTLLERLKETADEGCE